MLAAHCSLRQRLVHPRYIRVPWAGKGISSTRLLSRQRIQVLSSMSSTSELTPLDKWVDDLFIRIFFQPDDKLATESIESDLAPDLAVELNGKIIPTKAYIAMLQGFRKANHSKWLSNDTLTMVHDDESGRSGVVAHLGKFLVIDKASGEEHVATAVTISKVIWEGGRRVFKSVCEVQPL